MTAAEPAPDPEPRMPAGLQEIIDDFAELDKDEKLQLLLEFANGLPDLPARYSGHPDLLEPVPECQSPIFLVTEVEEPGSDGGSRAAVARLFFSAPREAPTTRGFAGVLHAGLDGLPVTEVLAVPADFSAQLPVSDVVSPLRLRGLAAMLARVKRQLAARLAAGRTG